MREVWTLTLGEASTTHAHTHTHTPPALEPNCLQILMFLRLCPPLKKREWAAPGGTAIPGQPVGRVKQASLLVPSCKNWINSLGAMPPLELLNSKEQLFLLDLSQKAEKR